MNLNSNDPYARPPSSYPKYNYQAQISPQKPAPPSTLPVSYPAEVFPPNDDFSSDQQNTPLHGFDINESEILKTDSNRILGKRLVTLEGGGLERFDATPKQHVRNFQQAGTRHLVGFQNEQISPLKVASSKDLFETEADLNVNQDLLKNSGQQSSIASALRVARPDAPTPSRTDDSAAGQGEHDGLDQYLMGQIKQRLGGEDGNQELTIAPNQLKPIVFQSFEEGDSSRRRFSPNPCTPHSPSTFMADLRLNSSVLSNMNPQECKFCSAPAGSKSLKGVIRENLNAKYLTSRDFYNVKIINDIIYNECTHIVSIFKDYLIFDDISEFLKRFYRHDETRTRLPKIFEFYDKYSKVFPNYVILGESKYMFKNIERKQRAIDEKNQQLVQMNKNKKGPRGMDDLDATDSNRLFSTRFINSVNQIKKLGMSSSLANTKRNTTEKSMSVNLQHHKRQRPLEQMPLDQLVEKFLAKDSEIFSNQQEIKSQEVKKQPHPKIQTYPKPKIVGFQGSGGNNIKSDFKGEKAKKTQKEVREEKKNGLLNLNIVNNYNHIVNENHFQAQTVNIHHNNYFDPSQSRNRAARQQPRMQPQEAPKPQERNNVFTNSRKSTDLQQPYRTTSQTAQKEERSNSKELSHRSKTASNLSGQQTSGLARTTSRPYLHEDPRAKITSAKSSTRPLSSHAEMSSATPSGKIVGTAQLVSATHRPLSGSASQQVFQTFGGQPQPAFGSSTATNRIPDGFGNTTPRSSSKGSTGVRKDRGVREGRKNSARADYQVQYQEYVNEYAKKREQQKPSHQDFLPKSIENPVSRKMVPSLKLDDLASNFHAMVKSPPLSPNSARTAGRPGFGLEFVREEDQGALTTRGILASNEYARKRGGDAHSARRTDKPSSQVRQIPTPTYGNYFSHDHMAQPYANIQQITALQKGSSIASSQNQGTVGSIRSEQELSGPQNMGAIPEIKPASGSNSARGNKSIGKKPNKLKSTDLAPSTASTAGTRRPQYANKVQNSSNYHQQQKSPVVNTIGFRVRQGSQSNLTSGSMKSKGELPSGELSYGSSKENQPSSRHLLLQSTPKNLDKVKDLKYNPVPSYEVGYYQTPLHLTSSASRSQRGGSVSSNGSQQPVPHYNQVPNVASKMTASVLAKRQPSVRGVSSSSNSSSGSQRPAPHHQRSKEKHDTFGSGHYGGFCNRQSFGQLGGGYSQYNYQQPQLQHPANQHYNGSAAVREQAFGGQSSARGSHFDYMMSSSGGKHSLLSRQSPYEVKLQNSGHYTKPQSSGSKKKMAYSRSVQNLQGSKGVRGYQAHYQAQVAQASHRHQAPLTGTPVQSAQETKFLKTLEQKTNQFLKAHNSREKFFSGGQGQDFSLKNEDLKYTSTHYGGKTPKEASAERFLGTQSYQKHHMFK